MITSAHYTAITGEAAPADFLTLRDRVVARLESALGRKLTKATRTETLACFSDGLVYPSATPVLDATGYSFDADAIHTGRRSGPGRVTVTYTGGYGTHNSTASATNVPCPENLATAIAFAVRTLAAPQAAPVPAGVTSLNIAGEYSISRDPGAVIGADGELVPAALASIADLGGRCATLVSAYRRLA